MASNREPSTLEKSRAAGEKTGGVTILLVEDEASIRKLMTRFLGLNGFTILAAEDPRAALELWDRHADEVTLLLTDVIMPGALSGKALATRLQAARPGLKVLYTSGYSFESLHADGSLDDDIHFLQKPYRPDQLLAAVRAVLAGSFPEHQNQNQTRYAETIAC
jgi:two-component system, cell cycle sensor histidine kinase and response regulator CckA